jgi:pimeloyl-ACP methyl ester carboxylesterase
LDEGKISSGDIKLYYRAEGPLDGEPVLLLHGFPQFSYEWRYALKALGEAGYRAVAPDLRGYGQSDRPEGIEAYRMQNLIGDVGAFYKAFGWSSANLVVHDWGGAIGWLFATYQPKLVKKFVAIDIAHPAAFRKAQLEDVGQLQKSWYIWFFQAPEVPERVFGGENIDRFMNWIFQLDLGRKIFTPEDVASYREMLLQPGQLTAAINYYRANSTPQNLLSAAPVKTPLVQAPTLLIYGTEDWAFSQKAWDECAQYCGGSFRAVALEGVSHWAVEEAPEKVNQLLLEHLQS